MAVTNCTYKRERERERERVVLSIRLLRACLPKRLDYFLVDIIRIDFFEDVYLFVAARSGLVLYEKINQ